VIHGRKPDATCTLIGNFGRSEIRMIRYIEATPEKCGFALAIADQLRVSYRNTEAMQKMVCAVARQAQRRGPMGPVGDFDDIDLPPLTR
jgi:hypothetical protein